MPPSVGSVEILLELNFGDQSLAKSTKRTGVKGGRKGKGEGQKCVFFEHVEKASGEPLGLWGRNALAQARFE